MVTFDGDDMDEGGGSQAESLVSRAGTTYCLLRLPDLLTGLVERDHLSIVIIKCWGGTTVAACYAQRHLS